MFDLAAELLSSIVATAAGVSVTYRRGAQSATLTAAIGKTEFDLMNSAGLIERVESIDWLFETTELEDFETPVRGDQIDYGDDTFEVMNFGSEPHFRYTDPYHKQMRLRTKRVG